jgi:hypothetical protein
VRNKTRKRRKRHAFNAPALSNDPRCPHAAEILRTKSRTRRRLSIFQCVSFSPKPLRGVRPVARWTDARWWPWTAHGLGFGHPKLVTKLDAKTAQATPRSLLTRPLDYTRIKTPAPKKSPGSTWFHIALLLRHLRMSIAQSVRSIFCLKYLSIRYLRMSTRNIEATRFCDVTM